MFEKGILKEPLLACKRASFVFSLCGDYFPFTFVNCFTGLDNFGMRNR